MFNPLYGIKSQIDPSTYILFENSNTIDSAISSFRMGWTDTIKSAHSKWIDSQKQLFKSLKQGFEDADDYAYKIITTKYEIFSSSMFGFIKDKSVSLLKTLYEHNVDTDKQARFIKAVLNHESNYKHKMYPNDGIGYRTISIPAQKDISKLFSNFGQAWSNMEPLDKYEVYEHFPSWFIDESRIKQTMEDKIEYCFDKGKQYSIKDYMECYDKFKSDIRKYVEEVKEKKNELKEYLQKIHTVNAKNYKDYIKGIEKLHLTEEERDTIQKIASHNYSILTNVINTLIMSCMHYFKHLYILIFNSCAHFKDVIQRIYDDLYEAKVDTKHGSLH